MQRHPRADNQQRVGWVERSDTHRFYDGFPASTHLRIWLNRYPG